MRILCTGAAGMLGSALVPVLRQAGHDVIVTDIDRLDVRHPSDIALWMSETMPDVVAHLAAETSLEVCENDPDHAWLTNALGTQYVAQECARTDTPMAYISSAGIFDGTKETPYTEFDEPKPINVYGASKYQGEKFVRQYVANSWVARAGWMIGGGPALDHKFVSHIVNQLRAGALIVYAVSDLYGTPTYANDFSRQFERLITGNRYGTYHLVSPGSCSRLDVARAIVELLGYDVTVVPVPASYFKSDFFAPRPRSEVMRNYVLDLESRNQMRPWKEALAEYLEEWR